MPGRPVLHRDPAGRSPDNAPRAVAAILMAAFALSLGDAAVKAMSAGFSLWQIYVLRSALLIPLLLVLILRRPVARPPRAWRWMILRSLLLVLMWALYYAALPSTPLSVAAAGFYLAPLLITLFSSLLDRRPVRLRLWLAVALGFLGVLVMLRPEASAFSPAAALPVAAAALYAVAMLLTREKCAAESPLVLALTLNVTFVAVGATASGLLAWLALPSPAVAANPFLLAGWSDMNMGGWAAIAALALAALVGSILTAIAYQTGPAAIVASFDYSYLAFSALWGALVFATLPDALTFAGIGLIALSGLIAIRR